MLRSLEFCLLVKGPISVPVGCDPTVIWWGGRGDVPVTGEYEGDGRYIAAYGGVTCFTFNPGGTVDAAPSGIAIESLHDLEENLLLFFTGYSRHAGEILMDQRVRTEQSDREMLDNLHYVKERGVGSQQALERGETALFGKLMHEHWEHKKRRSDGMTNSKIDDWYELGREHGAIGGKLVGAGGGFLLFYSENHRRLREAMSKAPRWCCRDRLVFACFPIPADVPWAHVQASPLGSRLAAARRVALVGCVG